MTKLLTFSLLLLCMAQLGWSQVQPKEQHPMLSIISPQYPNLTKWLIAPLNVKVPEEVEAKVILLREAILDEGYALPEKEREAHLHAVKLCEILSHGFTERRKKQVAASLRIAQRTSYTPLHNQALDARRNYLMSWPQYEREIQQRAVLLQYRKDANMVASKKAEQEWLAKSLLLQKNASRHYRQMRHTMRELGIKTQPAAHANIDPPGEALNEKPPADNKPTAQTKPSKDFSLDGAWIITKDGVHHNTWVFKGNKIVRCGKDLDRARKWGEWPDEIWNEAWTWSIKNGVFTMWNGGIKAAVLTLNWDEPNEMNSIGHRNGWRGKWTRLE